ncbi:MAG: L-threonylcarbamoyladenylate synthase [Chloroflexota bacterium]|nr:L-threonylcarbamoyladenylate synthase [Chloroflexota bacterium]
MGTNHTSPSVLTPDDAGIDAAVALLAAGNIIAAPTDTVYGIAARLDRPDALRRLFLAKERPEAKAIPILLGDARVAAELSGEPHVLIDLAEAFWPGALTIVTVARPGLPSEVVTFAEDGSETVALRLPDNDSMRALCRKSGGALAVTSANASGEPPATSASAVIAAGLLHLAAVVDGGKTPGPLPSTIVSVAGSRLRVIREGVIPGDRVASAWREVNATADMRGMISQ